MLSGCYLNCRHHSIFHYIPGQLMLSGCYITCRDHSAFRTDSSLWPLLGASSLYHELYLSSPCNTGQAQLLCRGLTEVGACQCMNQV